MPKISREGVSIYYEFHESEVGKSASTILLSHGYSATSAMWTGQISALCRQFNVITWDMRGHGKSDSPDDHALYSEALTIGDMLAILDVCNIERVIVAGLSLGGYMTLAFHASYPDRCVALMLFDTGPGYKNDAARNTWNEMAQQRAGEFESKGLNALGRGREVSASKHFSAQGLALAARGMLAQVNDRVIQSLPAISVSTLILVGELDKLFLAPSEYMARKIPQSIKVVLEKAGHAANIDQPKAFNAAVLSFLASI